MALEDKQAGQKWFAFELNNILKELRQIIINILALNSARHWDYISTTSGTSITAPLTANFAVITTNEGDIILDRTGKTSGNSGTVTASWSGSTITISASRSIWFYT
jgi:hypothetical protein